MKRNRTPLFPSIHLDGYCRPANPASQPYHVAGNIMPMVTGTIFLYNHSSNTISRFTSSSISSGYNHLITDMDALGIRVHTNSFNK